MRSLARSLATSAYRVDIVGVEEIEFAGRYCARNTEICSRSAAAMLIEEGQNERSYICQSVRTRWTGARCFRLGFNRSGAHRHVCELYRRLSVDPRRC